MINDFQAAVRDNRFKPEFPEDLKLKERIENWTVVMDNAGIQRHSSVTGFFFANHIDLVYNAAYSPQLMPIETFFSMLERFTCTKTFVR